MCLYLEIMALTEFRSVQREGVVEIIANDQGHRITPSWVSFTDDERLYVQMKQLYLSSV
jgi:molecular chaperone DnaK (HSP70)